MRGLPESQPTRERYCTKCKAALAPGHDECFECGHNNGNQDTRLHPNANPDALFVASSRLRNPAVMRGLTWICTACSRNMALRIANALNAYTPNRRGH